MKSPPQNFKILGGHLSLYIPHQCECLCDLFLTGAIGIYGMFALTDPESQSDTEKWFVLCGGVHTGEVGVKLELIQSV